MSKGRSLRPLKFYGVFLICAYLSMTFSVLAWSVWFEQGRPFIPDKPALSKFTSYEELKAFLNRSRSGWPPYFTVFRATVFADAISPVAKESAIEYSGTNIQVEGVDEADIVKCDGEYIYFYAASDEKVLIVRAYPPEESAVTAEIKTNRTVTGLFINEDRLVIFEFGLGEVHVQPEGKGPWFRGAVTTIKVYDVADRANPVLLGEISVDGAYFTSRMIGEYIYVLVNEPVYICEGEVRLPVITDGEEVTVIGASEIYYANSSDRYHGFTTMLALNVQNVSQEPSHETFLLGASRAIYVSRGNIYLAIPRYEEKKGIVVTDLHRIRISQDSIEVVASGQVPGYVLNQFSMDEHNGYFRIATTTGHLSRVTGQATSSNNVYVLDMSLTIVGRLENIAPGERIYSARFMGDRCYLVTFKKVDPLFVISLEDPEKPEILGKLKIPGYSDYLHPYGENYLIGIGKETVEAEEGDFAWYQGVKISLFDVSDVEKPKEISKYIIGDRGTNSPILKDHKALLFDEKRKLLAIPVLVAEIDEEKYPEGVPPNAYGEYVWQGLYVFTVDETGLSLRGRVTHIENPDDFEKSGFYFRSEYTVKRALYIENLLYSISDGKIKVNDLSTLQQMGEIVLP
jgi:uncharacterized secreted protein with C-terminal beta-propeller domain